MESKERDDLIWSADGFAQVLPRDKREVVIVLKETFKIVVGMTGDGVNDAPALSAAQCGIAVDDATDAAKNAAAIILTSPGLSAIYSAVVESRRIFRKLKSYVGVPFLLVIQNPFDIAASYVGRLKVDWAEEGAGIINLSLTGTKPEKRD